MSFQIPNRVPTFDAYQRDLENNYWHAAHSSRSAADKSGLDLSRKIGNFIRPNREFEMYKDKSYYHTSRRGPRRRRSLWIMVFIAIVVFLLWFRSGGNSEKKAKNKNHGIKGMSGSDLWKWIQRTPASSSSTSSTKSINWEERRQRVKDAFLVSWEAYEQDAWGKDVYHPISKRGSNMIKGGMGWIIVDALDTMMLMNLTTHVQNARKWIQTSLRYDQDNEVNTFETSIRMLGGLLSAHYLSKTYPNLAPLKEDDVGAAGEDLYIEKATDLADRLVAAFDSPSGIPYASLNLNKSEGVMSHADNGASSTAEASTLQLEFKYMAKLTGETNYWEKAEKVIQVIEGNGRPGGLVPIFIYPDTGKFMGQNIRLGSRGDSYYEYLIKQYLQTSKEEPIYLNMWKEALAGIRKYLITYTKHDSLMIVGERPAGLKEELSPKMDHLVCFLPGTIALGATGGLPLSKARKLPSWSHEQEEEILLAKELMKTCWATYVYPATGLAPEITHFELDQPPRGIDDETRRRKMSSDDPKLTQLDADKDSAWRKDINIKPADRHNLQRPETIESLFFLYRITGDETYRHWGWEMFKSFVSHSAVIEFSPDTASASSSGKDGDKDASSNGYIRAFTSLENVKSIPAEKRDNMESFWLAETLKYFYLLFSEPDFIPVEETVFNTEAHIFPRFQMGKLFKTGWKRKFEWKG
ncbi:mannosyl-oligosaccharide alpha-1,2-mannosidase [Myotisia sp. PD_48]|nr:mannosyl-oligosaccharide alpha-1,2-mannosidase [Myotisia sp. PD_48]